MNDVARKQKANNRRSSALIDPYVPANTNKVMPINTIVLNLDRFLTSALSSVSAASSTKSELSTSMIYGLLSECPYKNTLNNENSNQIKHAQ